MLVAQLGVSHTGRIGLLLERLAHTNQNKEEEAGQQNLEQRADRAPLLRAELAVTLGGA